MCSDKSSRKLTAAEVLARYNEERWSAFCDPLTYVNQMGTFGDRPLHLASHHGNIEEMEALIKGGADVNAIGEKGFTPLHNAIGARHAVAVKLLLEHGARTDIRNEFGRTALDLADLQLDFDVMAVLKDWNKQDS